MSGAYDDLYTTANGAARWWDNAPADQRAWLNGLADHIIEVGAEPTWARAGSKFRETFGLDRKPVDSTIAETVRWLVEERG